MVSRLLSGFSRIDPAADPAVLARCGEAVRARLEGEFGARNRGGRRAALYLCRDFVGQRVRSADSPDRQRGGALHPVQRRRSGGRDIRTSSTHYFDDSHREAAALARRIDTLLGLDRAHAETMQGQRYLPGEQYRHRCDFFRTECEHWQRERRRGGQRTWTAMVYLNAVEAGGATEFPKLDLTIRPEPGMLVVWNNMTRGGKPNRATLHAGLPVEAGRKYVVTQWYRSGRWLR